MLLMCLSADRLHIYVQVSYILVIGQHYVLTAAPSALHFLILLGLVFVSPNPP